MKFCHKFDYSVVIVSVSFVLHFITFGIIQSYGIVFSDLMTVFETGKGDTAWSASINTGVMMISGPVAGILVMRLGNRVTAMLGCLLASMGMLLSTFASSVYWLYITYGFVTGLGFGLAGVAKVVSVNLHTSKHRSLSMGIAAAGSSVGTVLLPFFFMFTLEHYSWYGTFIMMGAMCFQAIAFGALLRPVKSEGTTHGSEEKLVESIKVLIGNGSFAVFILSGSLIAMVYILPFVMLPDLMLENGSSQEESATVVTISGITGIFGRIVIGWLSDKSFINRCYLHGLILMIAGVVTALCGHIKAFPVFILYGVYLGVFTGTFSVLQPVIVQDLVGRNRMGIAFGVISFFHGVCVTIGTPIGGLLADFTGNYKVCFYFAGTSFFIGGILLLAIPRMNYNNNNDLVITCGSEKEGNKFNDAPNFQEQSQNEKNSVWNSAVKTHL